jgi:allantoin racemase
MKILNLLPIVVDTGFWTDEMIRYITKYLLPTTQVDTWFFKRGPSSIEGQFDESLCAGLVALSCVQARRAGYDGVFVDCFCDAGVRAAREAVDIPVFGGFEPVVHYALGTADKLGIVTMLQEVVPMLRGLIAQAGLNSRIVSLRSVNIPILQLGDTPRLVSALDDQCKKAIVEDGAETIVLGCTAMVGVRERVVGELAAAGYNIPVIEAAQAALVMLETYVRMGIHHSRFTYKPPREKTRTWWDGEISVPV